MSLALHHLLSLSLSLRIIRMLSRFRIALSEHTHIHTRIRILIRVKSLLFSLSSTRTQYTLILAYSHALFLSFVSRINSLLLSWISFATNLAAQSFLSFRSSLYFIHFLVFVFFGLVKFPVSFASYSVPKRRK